MSQIEGELHSPRLFPQDGGSSGGTDNPPTSDNGTETRGRVRLTTNALDSIAKAARAEEQAPNGNWKLRSQGMIVPGEPGSITIHGGRNDLKTGNPRLAALAQIDYCDYSISLWPEDTEMEIRNTVYGTYWMNREGEIIRTYPVRSETVTPTDTVIQDNMDWTVLLDKLEDDNSANFAAMSAGFKIILQEMA